LSEETKPVPKTLLREPKVLAKTGYSHSTLWAKVAEGKFPAPVRLDGDGGRAVAWVESEIDDLIEAAIKRRNAADQAAA
jgi:prophage regulatory protein